MFEDSHVAGVYTYSLMAQRGLADPSESFKQLAAPIKLLACDMAWHRLDMDPDISHKGMGCKVVCPLDPSCMASGQKVVLEVLHCSRVHPPVQFSPVANELAEGQYAHGFNQSVVSSGSSAGSSPSARVQFDAKAPKSAKRELGLVKKARVNSPLLQAVLLRVSKQVDSLPHRASFRSDATTRSADCL